MFVRLHFVWFYNVILTLWKVFRDVVLLQNVLFILHLLLPSLPLNFKFLIHLFCMFIGWYTKIILTGRVRWGASWVSWLSGFVHVIALICDSEVGNFLLWLIFWIVHMDGVDWYTYKRLCCFWNFVDRLFVHRWIVHMDDKWIVHKSSIVLKLCCCSHFETLMELYIGFVNDRNICKVLEMIWWKILYLMNIVVYMYLWNNCWTSIHDQ